MDKGRNLLPWIVGGLSMATLAVAITVGWAKGIAPNNSPAPSQTKKTAREKFAISAMATAPATSATRRKIDNRCGLGREKAVRGQVQPAAA